MYDKLVEQRELRVADHSDGKDRYTITGGDAKVACEEFVEDRTPVAGRPTTSLGLGDASIATASISMVPHAQRRRHAQQGEEAHGVADICNEEEEEVTDDELRELLKGDELDEPHRNALKEELGRRASVRDRIAAARKRAADLRRLAAEATDPVEQRRLFEEAEQEAINADKEDADETTQQELQRRIRLIGKCPAGFIWISRGDGSYCCSAGGHVVTKKELHDKFGYSAPA
jgi:hypothetical protein